MFCRKKTIYMIGISLALLGLFGALQAQEKPALVAVEMVRVQGGQFEMGDTFDEGFVMEKPVRTVKVNSFFIGKYEVTFDQYDAFVEDFNKDLPENEPSLRKSPADEGWGRGNRPVINVSWIDATVFCNWLSAKEGLNPYYTHNAAYTVATINVGADGYRLPTEAEWEYAAREGGKKVRFGNGKETADPSQINFDGNEKYKTSYSVAGQSRGRTLAVGSFAPNSLGLFDMAGNVSEWCYDYYHAWFYTPPKPGLDEVGNARILREHTDNPTGPDLSNSTIAGRVARGGSWLSDANYVRSANRGNSRQQLNSYNNVGFRVVRNAVND